MKVSTKILAHLANSEVARNDYQKGYIEYILNECEYEFEKAIVDKILNKCITQASYQREVAFVQNTLELFEANPEVKEKRQKHRRKRQDFFGRFKELFINN